MITVLMMVMFVQENGLYIFAIWFNAPLEYDVDVSKMKPAAFAAVRLLSHPTGSVPYVLGNVFDVCGSDVQDLNPGLCAAQPGPQIYSLAVLKCPPTPILLDTSFYFWESADHCLGQGKMCTKLRW